MKIAIGIDTGGTCTDAVAYDYSANRVLAKGKTLTTREDLSVGIAYGTDIALAKKTAVEALASLVSATGDKLVKEDPAPMAEISSFGESAVVLTVRGWCATADYWGVYFAGNQALKAAFDKAGVAIPFPQMDVHVKQA